MCVCGGGLAIPIHPPTLPLSCWQSWWCVLVAALWIWRAVSGQGSFTTLLWPPHIHIHLLWQWDDDLNWGLCNSFQNIMCLCLFKHHLPVLVTANHIHCHYHWHHWQVLSRRQLLFLQNSIFWCVALILFWNLWKASECEWCKESFENLKVPLLLILIQLHFFWKDTKKYQARLNFNWQAEVTF